MLVKITIAEELWTRTICRGWRSVITTAWASFKSTFKDINCKITFLNYFAFFKEFKLNGVFA
jgi:hypothetical protein